jgi:hypothetical protein
MNVAFKTVKEVHIFSLEGVVKSGMLPKLQSYQYDSTVAYNQNEIEGSISVQKKVKLISTILSYPTLFLLTILLILTLFVLIILFVIKRIIRVVRG